MRRKIKVIFAVVGFIVLSFWLEGWGANWKHTVENVFGDVIFIDMASRTRSSDNIVRVWVKLVYSQKSVLQAVEETGKQECRDVNHTLNLMEYDCRGKRSRILSEHCFSKDDFILDNRIYSSPEWESTMQDSIWTSVLKAVCE